MGQNRAYVSLESLLKLQNELKSMAEDLQDMKGKAQRSLDTAKKERLRDAQFYKLADSFEEQMNKIEEVSREFRFLADVFLQKRIDMINEFHQIHL